MDITREAVVFESRGNELVGIFDLPARQMGRGVLIVTGGPQYRVGSHRQFVQIARWIASCGHPVMRFDYSGMGDGDGELADFRYCLPDIRSAIDVLLSRTSAKEVVLWGLCDAASASLIYSPSDDRVAGLVLLNPWVRTDEGLARAYIKHYYVRRLFAKDFWTKLASGGTSFKTVLAEAFRNIRLASSRNRENHIDDTGWAEDEPVQNFRQCMLQGLAEFKGQVLLILCGDDLTAAEFVDHASASKHWRRLLKKVQRRELRGADHTFSTERWRTQVGRWTTEWLSSW